jgi:hypothetical protein
VLVVLGGGAHHGRAADVDELDRRVRGEGVQVRHDEVDADDVVGLEVGQMFGLGTIGEDAAVDLRVERLHPAPQHFGRARDVGGLGVRDTGLGELRGRVATGDQLPPQIGETLGQLDETLLVVDR